MSAVSEAFESRQIRTASSPESWPLLVLLQQQRHMDSFFLALGKRGRSSAVCSQSFGQSASLSSVRIPVTSLRVSFASGSEVQICPVLSGLIGGFGMIMSGLSGVKRLSKKRVEDLQNRPWPESRN
ncbi:hypothetical protein AXG93_406s1250 [Marchantia polymorpha subsp. ruderalis]|uniref:Uncharacterized protein n=1 Tax=Marchantia polymorpha subsp. ruderalis TaxID=1480154 RepID=A0A176VC68_MARPO|nr:hypothetical protein AXG93_406s1250 [Marchantia polymorpha subsp. ruderalis]